MIVFQRLSATKMNKIILCFSEDLTASTTAKIVGVNRNTVNRYFTGIRKKIARYSVAEYHKLIDNLKTDKIHFKSKTVLGKSIKRILDKRPILGVLKHRKNVFITILEDFSNESLLTRLRENLYERYSSSGGVVSNLGLFLKGYDQYRVCLINEKSDNWQNDAKGIDNFLMFAKKRLAKFNGCSAGSLLLHLKECEFRYNHRDDDLFKLVKNIFQKY